MKFTPSSNSSGEDQPNILASKLVLAVRSKKSQEAKVMKLQELLAQGADINFVDANRKNTILHVAVRKQELKVIAFLVEQNANIHIKNANNKGALDLAEQLQRKDIIDILTKCVASEKQGNTELDIHNKQMKQRIASEIIAMNTKPNEITSRPTFKKGTGDSGFSGQCYEISLLTLFKLRGEHQTTNFYLGCNVDSAGAFDDVVFKYWDANGKWRIILLQAKHRDHGEMRSINMQTFKRGGDLELHKYFTSFLEIKSNFNAIGGDPIFKHQYDNSNFDFVIYTNACLDNILNELICPNRVRPKSFRIANSGKAIKLRVDDMLPYLAEQELEKHVIVVAKAFVQFMFAENKENKMADDLVRIYHVFWAKKLVKVSTSIDDLNSGENAKVKPCKPFRKVIFRTDFLNNRYSDPNMMILRNVIFHEYAKKTMIIKTGKKSVNAEKFKTDWSEFTQLLSCNSKVVNYSDIGESLVESLCNLTGIIITYEAESRHLKFVNKDHLGIGAKQCMEGIENVLQQSGRKSYEIHEFRFNILIEIVIRKLQREDFKVPKAFGNINPTFANTVENMCTLFVDTLERCERKPGNVFIIPGMSRILLRDVCKWVGNILVLNDKSGYLQLTDKNLEGQSKLVFEQLTCALILKGFNVDMDFHFQMDYFPRLQLGNFKNVEKEIEEFISNLIIYTDQPDGKALRETVVEDLVDYYKLTAEEAWQNYLKINDKVTRWWEKTGKVHYLRKGDGFFSDIVRTGIHYRLRYPVASFTGRQKELAFLHESLQMAQKSKKLTVISQMSCVSGLGGIGKSELARQYAFLYGYCYDHNVIWIEADNYMTMANSFRNLSRTRLNIPTQNADGSEKDIKLVVQQVYSFFSKRKSLFIFDNAEKFRSERSNDKDGVAYFLPRSFSKDDEKPCFILTSRNQSWPSENVLLLDIFSNDEAMTFVKSFLKVTDDLQDNDVKTLTILLQNFPLALQQAVAYIRERDELNQISGARYQISDYVNFYEQKTREMLDFKFPEDSVDLYTKTTFITWQITVETIGKLKYGTEAKHILNMMAFLNPNDIPMDLFNGIAGSNEQDLKLSIKLLKQYSMISLDNGTGNIHRVVQQVTRVNVKEKGMEEHVLGSTLSLLNDVISRKEVTSHGISAWLYASKHEDLVREYLMIPSKILKALQVAVRFEEARSFGTRALDVLSSVTDTEYFAQHELACVLTSQGKFDEALRHCLECLEKRVKLLGINNGETLVSKNALGRLWHLKGQYVEAIKCFREVFEDACKLWGPDDEISILAQSNIANVLFSQCHYDEALRLYNDILDKRIEIFGADHPSTLTCQHSKANVLNDKGDYLGAMRLYELVLEKRSEVLGFQHPDTIKTENDIGNCLFLQCKYDEALRCYKQVLEKWIKVLGVDHPHSLISQNNMANVLQRQEKYEEALSLYQENYKKECESKGHDHPDALGSLQNIAIVLSLQGKHSEAIHYLTDVLEKEVALLGPIHMNTLTVRFNIGRVLSNQGKYELAERSYREVYEITCATYGSGHPFALTMHFSIAIMLEEQGKYEEALQIFQEVVDKRKDVLGPNHPETLDAHIAVAVVLTKQRKLERALFCQNVVLDKCIILHGWCHELTRKAQSEIAFLLNNLGKYNEALVYYAEVFEKRAIVDANHPETMHAQFGMAAVLQNQMKSDHAYRNFMDVYLKRTEVLGLEHPDTLTAQLNIGHQLTELNNLDEALSTFADVFKKRLNIFGSSHADTLVAQHNVAHVFSSLGKHEEALHHFQEVLAIRLRVLGPDHDETFNAQFFVGYAQYYCGKYDDALKSFVKVYARWKHTLGDTHPNTVSVKDYIECILLNRIATQ